MPGMKELKFGEVGRGFYLGVVCIFILLNLSFSLSIFNKTLSNKDTSLFYYLNDNPNMNLLLLCNYKSNF